VQLLPSERFIGPIVTTPGPEVSVATLDVAKTCELETVKKLNLVGVGQVFCAELENASTYRFHYLIPPDTNTWAVGDYITTTTNNNNNIFTTNTTLAFIFMLFSGSFWSFCHGVAAVQEL
jgi:hypothetical protein